MKWIWINLLVWSERLNITEIPFKSKNSVSSTTFFNGFCRMRLVQNCITKRVSFWFTHWTPLALWSKVYTFNAHTFPLLFIFPFHTLFHLSTFSRTVISMCIYLNRGRKSESSGDNNKCGDNSSFSLHVCCCCVVVFFFSLSLSVHCFPLLLCRCRPHSAPIPFVLCGSFSSLTILLLPLPKPPSVINKCTLRHTPASIR